MSRRLAVDADAAWQAAVGIVAGPDGRLQVGDEVVVERLVFGREAAERTVVDGVQPPADTEPGTLALTTAGTAVASRRVRVVPRGDLACDVELAAMLPRRHRLLAATVGRLVAAAVRRSLVAELDALENATR